MNNYFKLKTICRLKELKTFLVDIIELLKNIIFLREIVCFLNLNIKANAYLTMQYSIP